MAAVLWWPMAAWISPATAWFIFFNTVVAAIALMSSAHRADGGALTPSGAARRRLCRSGSSMVLDRLWSFSIFAVHPVAATGAPIGDDATAAASESQFYCYGTREAEAAAAAQVLAPEQPGRIQKAVAATATSSAAPPSASVALASAEDHAAPVAPAPENDEEHNKAEPEAEEEQDESISLDEAYALARRLRAQELASPPSPPPAPATATVTARTKKPARKVVPDGISRRRTKAEEAMEGKAELNARAELFIRQFREELKLQRLNSTLSYTHALRSPTAAR
ncbi:hypothetical protein SEVIR_6G143400v4 [Setaria viridis]|uniref:DUF4408 domain-containing protein n=4 Tax=Setaria TaxID=4554 RepID=K3YJ10_SETIT|nr:uncharacterized protein LOC105914630 [Setaria italica]XP_034599126.1 uncharacterized protein LOC117860027 [Setaria viridis]TKW10150.1 hypothetical protein SEVIR_6G143400v2 [Setaria viridis]